MECGKWQERWGKGRINRRIWYCLAISIVVMIGYNDRYLKTFEHVCWRVISKGTSCFLATIFSSGCESPTLAIIKEFTVYHILKFWRRSRSWLRAQVIYIFVLIVRLMRTPGDQTASSTISTWQSLCHRLPANSTSSSPNEAVNLRTSMLSSMV